MAPKNRGNGVGDSKFRINSELFCVHIRLLFEISIKIVRITVDFPIIVNISPVLLKFKSQNVLVVFKKSKASSFFDTNTTSEKSNNCLKWPVVNRFLF